MTDAATRLGQKLAALELDEEEAAALVMLIGGEVHAEVSGFLFGSGGGVADVRQNIFGPVVRELRVSNSFNADTVNFGVEREMKESGE